MNLQGKRILDWAIKPLLLWEKAFFLSSKSSGSSGGSSDHPYRPSPPTHAPITSSPLIPTFFLLMIVLLLMSFSTPVQHWLTKLDKFPTLAEIFALSRKDHPNALPRAGENVGVWTIKQAGFYYCQGGALFGSKPGQLMTQDEALLSGYRPAGGDYCAGIAPGKISGESVPARIRDSLGSLASKLPNPDQVFASGWNQAPAALKPSDRVSVWAKKQTGFYYCQGGILFGSKPGQLMTQAEALSSGYRPVGGEYCTHNKPGETSPGSPPLRTMTSIK